MKNARLNGRCACGNIRYTLTNSPLIVHACYCRDCQRFTGSAFVINLWIETKFVEVRGVPKSCELKGGSRQAHEVFFCERCGVYLWSRYQGARGDFRFVRGGTLDHPEAVRPDVHIFTRSKLPWLQLPPDAPAFATFYPINKIWPPASKERLKLARTENS